MIQKCTYFDTFFFYYFLGGCFLSFIFLSCWWEYLDVSGGSLPVEYI